MNLTSKPKKYKKFFQLAFLSLVAFGVTVMTSSDLKRKLRLHRYYKKKLRERRLDKSLESIPGVVLPYNQEDIVSLAWGIPGAHPMILVFDGTGFKSYFLGHSMFQWRYVNLIPLMVHALESNYPHRFQSGQPVFQMVFTISDFLATECASAPHRCPINAHYPPFVSFATVYQNSKVFPTARAFPNPAYSGCISNWKLKGEQVCNWKQVDRSINFEDLENKIIWRGSDFCFLPSLYNFQENNHQLQRTFSKYSLATRSDSKIMEELMNRYHQLTPRWKAVILSLRERILDDRNASSGWIDALFSGSANEDVHHLLNERGLIVSEKETMDSVTMSKYKYQIDLGGGGGTTWEGTLTKLLMPGVLFHHVTPTKDWFYDLMEPYVHYIPVDLDLKNLRAQYEWAEANPERVKMIAENSTKFAEYLLSSEYIEKIYKELFVDYFRELIDAYQHEGLSWKECLANYKNMGMKLRMVAHCDESSCFVEWGHGFIQQISKNVASE